MNFDKRTLARFLGYALIVVSVLSLVAGKTWEPATHEPGRRWSANRRSGHMVSRAEDPQTYWLHVVFFAGLGGVLLYKTRDGAVDE